MNNVPIDILYILSESPYPPNNGVRIPAYHSIRLMAKAGYRIAVIYFTNEQDSNAKVVQHMETMCVYGMVKGVPLPRKSMAAMAATCLLRNKPFFVPRFSSVKMSNAVSEITSKYAPAAVHLDMIQMIQYRPSIKCKCRLIASINDCHSLAVENSIQAKSYSRWQFLYRHFQLWQSRRYESEHYPEYDAVHVMAEADAGYLKELNEKIKTTIIPNGVDDSLFDLEPAESNRKHLLFIGVLSGASLIYLRRFIEISWAKIIREYPEAKLDVVGKLTPESKPVVRLARSIGNVNFRGYVESLVDAYRDTDISVVPLDKNCGIINKVIEAMAASRAVVAFSSAFNGIPNAIPGAHGIAVEGYEEMGTEICALLSDKRRVLKLGRRAAELAEQNYRWTSRGPKYIKMYFEG